MRNIKDLGVDFPIINSQIHLFEKGIKIMSDKLGSSIIFFKEVIFLIKLISKG